MRIEKVTESGYTLEMYGDRVAFVNKVPEGFLVLSDNILQVARDLRHFLLKGIQVTLCNGRFDFHNSDDPEALRAHLPAWGTKGKTVEEVEDEIIRWLLTQPKKSQVTVDTWECNRTKIIHLPWDTMYPYRTYRDGININGCVTLQGALDYARRNS